MKKATVDNLLKLKSEKDTKASGVLKVESLGLDFDYVKLPILAVVDIADEYDDTTKGQLDMACELIYMTCPVFRDKKLQDVCPTAEPHEIVLKVLGDDIKAVTELGKAVISLYNLDNMVEEVKK